MSKDKEERKRSNPEVLTVPDATEELRRENIRLREELAGVRQELTNFQEDTRREMHSMNFELQRANERESAHVAALRALSGHTENAALNQQRFEAIAKDLENFHRVLTAHGAQLTQILQRLSTLGASTEMKQ